MTVQDTPNFISYTGDNLQTVFNFTFRVDDVAWLSVDYGVNFDQFNLNLDQDLNPGGNATYLVAPPALQDLTITRDTPNSQELDYQRYDPFDSESHEDALDRLTMQIQDLEGRLSNLIQFGSAEGSILRWDTSGPISRYSEFGPGPSEFLLPLVDGAPGTVLQTDGLGQVSWVSVAAAAANTLQQVTDASPITNNSILMMQEVTFTDDVGIIFADDQGDTRFFLALKSGAGGANFLELDQHDQNGTFVKNVISVNHVGAITLNSSTSHRNGAQLSIFDGATNDGFRMFAGATFHQLDSQGTARPFAFLGFTYVNLGGMPLVMQETAAAIAPVGSSGQLWVRNDSPNVLMFTDDVGTDFVISAGGTPTFANTGFEIRSLGNTDAEERILELTHLDSTRRGFLGHNGSSRLDLVNEIHGSNLLIGSEDVGGTLRVFLNADPDSATEIRGDTALNLSSAAGAIQAVLTVTGQFQIPDTLSVAELAAAPADTAARGQFWVRNDVPNVPMFTDDVGTDQVVDPSVSEVNTQNGNYTTVIGDKGGTIQKDDATAAITATIQAEATVDYKIGTFIAFDNSGTVDWSIAIAGADTLIFADDGTTGTRTLAADGYAVAQKVAAGTWKIAGKQLT